MVKIFRAWSGAGIHRSHTVGAAAPIPGAAVVAALPHPCLLLAADGVVLAASPAVAPLFGGSAPDSLRALAGRFPDPGPILGLDRRASLGEAAAATLDPEDGGNPLLVRVMPVAEPPRARLWVLEEAPDHQGDASHVAPAENGDAARYRRTMEEAPVGMAIIDEGGRIAEANRAFFGTLGLDESSVGRPFHQFVVPEERSATAIRLRRLVDKGEDREAEQTVLEAHLQGGRRLVAQLFVQRVDGIMPDGESGLLLLCLDVSERKQLETQITQSQKMQAVGQLAGGIAHDFNNLLTAMIGFCDLLLLRHRPGDRSFSDIMQVKQNANRAANLVRQLLAFSRQQTLQARVLDVTDVLAEISHLLRRLIGENIELAILHGRDLGLVKVDQGQLEQVIINLAVNGRDAMPNGGRLTIATRNLDLDVPLKRSPDEVPPGAYVVIEVMDQGVGISAENLPRIFEPFFSTKEVGAGTGLGLSTVYGIVRQTGGYVLVRSRPGEGARFEVVLPRHEAAEVEPDETSAPDLATERSVGDLTGTETVLLVEDEDAVRVFGARALRNKGYTVVEAKNGSAALDQFRSLDGRIDLLITDVVMPEMDGPTLIRSLRDHRADLKVICISGYAEDRFRHDLTGGGSPVHYLGKPFSLKQLAAKVREVLGAGPTRPPI